MFKQDKFLDYLNNTYPDFKSHKYEQFVQILIPNKEEKDNKKDEVLSFHFNEKGFLDGAFYKKELLEKGFGEQVFGENKFKKWKSADERKADVSAMPFYDVNIKDDTNKSDIAKAIYNQIYKDMDLDVFHKKYDEFKTKKVEEANLSKEISSLIKRVNKENLFVFEDKTFILASELELPQLEKVEEVKGMNAVPIQETEFKDREVFDCGNNFLLVDKEKFATILSDFKIENKEELFNKVADVMEKMYPISREEIMTFLSDFDKLANGKEKEETEEKDDYEIDL